MRSIRNAILLALLAASASAELPEQVTNELYVSDFINDRIAVFSDDAVFLRSFTAPGLDGPRGIVFREDGTFYVGSQNNNTIYHFGRDQTVINQFSHALLTAPTGAGISPAGELHVSAFFGHRICVFTLDGTFLRSYTAPSFSTPNCIAFDTAGNIYAASAGRGSVYKFDVNELFVDEFRPPAGISLTSPMSVARDKNDVLWVSGGSSHNLVKFALDGTYLGEVKHPDLTGPQGVAFDDRGHVFSSSFYQDTLVEFDGDGNYIRTILTGGLSIPRSIAFDPGRIDTEFPSRCEGDGGDGLGCTDCPCDNNAQPNSGGGCLNSVGESARLHAYGTGSLTAGDLRFELDGSTPNALAVLISGEALAPQNPSNPCFGLATGFIPMNMDGLRCAVVDFRRHGNRPIDANGRVGAMAPGWGGLDAPAIGIGARAGFSAGQERHFQAFYRDDSSQRCGTGLNSSGARSVTFLP